MEPKTSSSGRPGPALTLGVPLILVAAGGYFGWTKLVQPALEQKAHEQTEEKLSQSTSLNQKKYGKQVKVAGDPWSGYSTFRNEPRLASALAKSGIGIEYVDDEKLYDQGARMEALASGKIDLALTTVDAFLQHGAKFKKEGLYPGVILWNIDESSGGDAIFLSKGKRGFDSVKPSDKVCFATGTPSEHLWDFASLSFSNLGDRLPTDNGVVAGDCWKKLRADQVQVAVLWQPFTAIAVKEGYPKVFATGGQADDVIIDVLVANREYVIREKETLKTLAQAYFEVIDGYVKEPEEHAKFITADCGADCGRDATLGRAVLDGIDFLTYEENMCLWWGQCGGANKMIERVGKTGKLLVAKGKLKAADQPEARTILNDSFLTGLKGDLEQRAKLAQEVAGKDTAVLAPVLEAKEKVYTYAAADTKSAAESDVGTLSLPNVYFPEGKATLDPNAKSVVAAIGDKLKSFPALCVRVYGHTNSSGNPDNNKRLSAARAAAIVDELRVTDASAFPAARFDARGFGSECPILKDGREDLDASRRTEFKLFNCGSKAVTSPR
jgi:outer membrane protein OmpA-like peptidoglycan-associated protein